MNRTLFSLFLPCLLTAAFAPSAMAGPRWLPHIHLLPKINLGKAGDVLTYPLKKSVVNGGKAAIDTAITIGTGQVINKLTPSPGDVAKKIIVWGVSKH